MRLRDRSGQTLLIAILIGTLLLLSIPILITLIQIGGVHQTANQQRVKARALAEEGLAYVIQQVNKSSNTWQAALDGSYDGTWAGGGASPTDCNQPMVPSPSGGGFKIYCSNDPTVNKTPVLQPYEIAVVVVAYLPSKESTTPDGLAPMRAIRAYLSQRTLGADLGDGLHAGVALQLVSTPSYNNSPTPYPPGPLTVHWGPVLILASNMHTLADPMDQMTANAQSFPGFPRVFSLGGIRGTHGVVGGYDYNRTPDTTATAATTDRKEYWAFASLTVPPVVDEDYYKAQAQNVTTGITPPAGGTPNCVIANCGYFDTGGTAVFDAATPGYTVPTKGSVIYVNGNAEFDKIAIDSATFVINGNLTINNPPNVNDSGVLPGPGVDFNVPQTSPFEYRYWVPGATMYPCSTTFGTKCISTSPGYPNATNIHFRGFLYVKGNVTVNNPAGNPRFNMVGSALVGDMQVTPMTGQLRIVNPSNFRLYYDAIINHEIQVVPVAGKSIRVVVDQTMDIPVP